MTTINAIEWCTRTNCKFLFLSTSRVYPIKNLDKILYIEEKQDLLGSITKILKGFQKWE